jgi:hypothetical protein
MAHAARAMYAQGIASRAELEAFFSKALHSVDRPERGAISTQSLEDALEEIRRLPPDEDPRGEEGTV